MGRIRRGLQRAARKLAQRVAQDDLFEKSGERAPSPPLPPRGAGAPARVEADAGGAPAASGPTACELADLARVQAALGPAQRPRVVNHWATWCAPCVEELPHLVRLAGELGDDAELLGLSWDLFDPRGGPEQVASQVQDFALQHGLSWPSLLVTAQPADFFAALEISWEKIPQTWVLAADGAVLQRFEGVVGAQQCAEILQLLRGS